MLQYFKFVDKHKSVYLHWPDQKDAATLVFIGNDGYVAISTNLDAASSTEWAREKSTQREFEKAFRKALSIIRENHKE